jgi:hypothetical protein
MQIVRRYALALQAFIILYKIINTRKKGGRTHRVARPFYLCFHITFSEKSNGKHK